MTALPVNAIFTGMQPDGYWAGTPSLIIRLMTHPDAAPVLSDDPVDCSYPLPEWDYEEANEVSLNTLMTRRTSSPHFASVGLATLKTVTDGFRERHILLVGREPGRHDIGPLVKALLLDGKTVQVETTGSIIVDPAGAWVTLRALPTRLASVIIPEAVVRANEVMATIRWQADIDRAERMFANRAAPVWLRPSAFAESWVYRKCVAAATRHQGWRVSRSGRQPMDA